VISPSGRSAVLATLLAIGMPPAAGAGAGEEPLAVEPVRTGVLHFAPSGGVLGEQAFFALRGAYSIAAPVDVEAEIGHNIGEVTSAFLHSAGVRVTGFRWRSAQVFATAGFGTFSAAESDAIAAKSVTRSHLRLGGGVEYAVRDDLGIRLDLRHHRVLLGGSDVGSEASLGVNELSLGLVFSRRIWSPPSSGSVTP
jgi:hypothetical protein